MNDLADDGFHEIQLSGKQLVFLFMATTVLAVVIFLCGVQVGRNVRSDRVADTGDLSASASPPPAASTPSQPAAAGGPPAAEPPAPASEPDDELSYAKRLQAESPAATSEKLKAAGEKPKAVAPVPTPAPAVTQTPPTEGRAQPARPAPKAQTPAPLGTPRPGNWVVQVTALKDRAAAGAIAQRLARNGYAAFVLDPAPGSPVIFRVQVGRFGDRSEADQVKRRLEKDDQYKPYVVAAR
ncbi:MAG TPA: SPOR domain-containing protein [Vicinamibacterales bacterium]|jgi:cell division septation protein DedD|nr:SPOR domain-containing protein [Vicinamibacterales bacterium]